MKEEIRDFIGYAKKQAYASTSSKPKITKEGGKTYIIKRGDYTYTDTYFGNLVDCGQERVYLKGKVIWVMAYRGGMISGNEKMDGETFDFLKKCISKIPKLFPARGPKKMKEGNFRYENIWQGDLDDFVGEENIYYKGKKVAFRNYLGGLVKNK